MYHYKHSAKRLITHVLMFSSIVLVVVLCLSPCVYSQPREITWQDLEELKSGKVPKHSTDAFGKGFLSTDPLETNIQTPRARAAEWAKAAKENYITLDSSNYNPDMFNRHVELYAYNLLAKYGAAKSDQLIVVERAVLVLSDDEFVEPDSVTFYEKSLQNAYGADYINIDASFFFPIKYFDGKRDLIFAIFDGGTKKMRKLKKKEIMKLE